MIIPANYNDFKYVLRYRFQKLLPRVFYPLILQLKYKTFYNQKLNLKNPEKLSEKIQWLKLHDNDALKTKLTDKLEVKKYVKELIPDLNTAKVYMESDSFEQLDFDKLPDTFILKTNHSWKTNILIKNKNEITAEKYKEYAAYYKQALKINFAYWSYYELQYKEIKPKIFAEEYIENLSEQSALIEYEAYCFNGRLEFVRVIYTFLDEYGKECCAASIYDRFGKELDFSIFFHHLDNDNINPDKLKQVIEYAQILSKNLKFVRVDFMEMNNILYFLELTFSPCSGFIKFTPEKYDSIYGSKLKL